jgi:hypothetical protein
VSFSILLESLKFYKMKNDRVVQIGFVFVYAVNLLIYVLPVGDSDFSAYYDMLTAVVETGAFPQPFAFPLTAANLTYLVANLLLSLFNLLMAFTYAALYVGEFAGQEPGQVFLLAAKALPRLLLLIFLLAVPALLSACLAFVPLIIFGTMMYFLPLLLITERSGLSAALAGSYAATRGRKLLIFSQVVLISFAISVPQNLILSFLSGAVLPIGIIASFFAVLQSFVQGRLMGILYLLIVKKAPLVLPSKPNERP